MSQTSQRPVALNAPPIGSPSLIPELGRPGTVVGAQAIGKAGLGQTLYHVEVKVEGKDAAGHPQATADNSGAVRGARPTGVATAGDALSAAERAHIAELLQRDGQVRQEENAHAAMAGSAAGAIQYDYQRGPDGRMYAVGGSVPIHAENPSGDPVEQRRLAGKIAAAAMAAINPSAADYAAASTAYRAASDVMTQDLPGSGTTVEKTVVMAA